MSELKPPTQRAIVRMLDDANDAFDGGDYVKLAAVPVDFSDSDYYWSVIVTDDPLCRESYGREWVPGDGKPFDSIAAARRLLAAFRDSTTTQGSK